MVSKKIQSDFVKAVARAASKLGWTEGVGRGSYVASLPKSSLRIETAYSEFEVLTLVDGYGVDVLTTSEDPELLSGIMSMARWKCRDGQAVLTETMRSLAAIVEHDELSMFDLLA